MTVPFTLHFRVHDKPTYAMLEPRQNQQLLDVLILDVISINLSVHTSCGKLDIEIVEVRDNVLANEQLYSIDKELNIHRLSTNIFSQIQTKYIYHGKLLHLREAKHITLYDAW